MNPRLPSCLLLVVLSSVVLSSHAASAQDAPATPKPDEAGPGPYEIVDAFPAQEKFSRPVLLDHNPADPDVYYVAEQYGRIFRIPRDGQKKGRALFLDWSEQSLDPKDPGGNNEEGLLGFAFDPAFAENGQVYIYYSHKTGERVSRRTGRSFPTRESVVSRLATKKTDGGLIAVPESEFVILRVAQPYGNHDGGTIAFGPDEMLYIALGDGGSANDPHGHAQNLGTLLGTILRIDVRGATAEKPYAIPADNPFVGKAGARGEIWAYGLRNVWRFAFDRKTGDLWAGDVGQNIWEEVDRIVKGGNYGWNKREGFHPFSARRARPARGGFGNSKDKPVEPEADDKNHGFLDPIAEYHHRDGVSITGGHVYRGKTMPELDGQYLYADYVSGRLWSVKEDRKGGKHVVTLLVRRAGAVASFGEGANGEVFLLRFDGDRISRLVPSKAKAGSGAKK